TLKPEARKPEAQSPKPEASLLSAACRAQCHRTVHFHHQFRAGRNHGGTPLAQPMSNGRACPDRSPDQSALCSARKRPNRRTRRCASSHFHQIALTVSSALELAFFIDIGPSTQARVHQRRIQGVSFTIRQNNGFRNDADRWLAGDPPWFGHSGDATLHRSANWNYGLPLLDDRLCHAAGKGFSFFAGEGCQRCLKFHIQCGAGRQRQVSLCDRRSNQKQRTNPNSRLLHSSSSKSKKLSIVCRQSAARFTASMTCSIGARSTWLLPRYK